MDQLSKHMKLTITMLYLCQLYPEGEVVIANYPLMSSGKANNKLSAGDREHYIVLTLVSTVSFLPEDIIPLHRPLSSVCVSIVAAGFYQLADKIEKIYYRIHCPFFVAQFQNWHSSFCDSVYVGKESIKSIHTPGKGTII